MSVAQMFERWSEMTCACDFRRKPGYQTIVFGQTCDKCRFAQEMLAAHAKEQEGGERS